MADKKQETIEDVVRKIRNEIAELRRVSPNVRSVAADWWEARADEIEAAHKRELSKNTSKNGADFGQLGDAAKLREAVGYILKYADCAACRDHDEHTRHYIDQIRKWAQSALAAPPRNCDRYNDATKAMAELKRRHHECAEDSHPCREDCPDCGKQKCAIAWLFAKEESEVAK